MRTIQTFECPKHGRMEVVIEGDAPETVTCCQENSDGTFCIILAKYRISAPAVSTKETQVRNLTGHVRDTNPW